MKSKEQPVDETITHPLQDLLYILLGDEHSGSPCKSIPYSTALILEYKLRSSLVYKLIWDESHTKATIWWYAEWKNDSERLAKQKAYSEKLRVEGWLLKANVDTIIQTILKQTKLPIETVTAMAYNILKNPQHMIVLDVMWGIKKLKTKEEEL